jgi:zinc protease
MKFLARALLLFPLLLSAACVTTPAPAPAPAPTQAPAPGIPEGSWGGLDPAAPLPVDTALIQGELDNGLRYFIRPNARPEDRAELRLVVNVGSLQEDDDQRGLAHFVEHMAFNGTEHFAGTELVQYLESVGMRFGPHVNAYTSFDETVYMLTVPTDDVEQLDKALLILRDWAGGLRFDGEEIDKERGVVVEEWRLGRGAGARVRDQQTPVLYRGSRYAERKVIGELEVLRDAPHEALRRFYRDWYRPELMAVVAVGDFEPQWVETEIRRRFSDLKNPTPRRPRLDYPVPGHEETLFSIVTDPELTRTMVSVHTKIDYRPDETVADFRRAMVRSMYHSLLNNRLAELSQEADPPFLFAFASTNTLGRTRGVAVRTAVVPSGGALRGLEVTLREVERAERFGFTAGELERLKKDMLRSYEQAWQERDKEDSSLFADELVRHFLEQEAIPGIAEEKAMAEALIPRITVEEVNRAAEAWKVEGNRVLVVVAPEDEAVPPPTEEELLAVFDGVAKAPLEPYRDEVLEGPLLAKMPTPGAVVEERLLAEVGVTEWRLDNGVRVVLKPTDFQNDEVSFTAYSPGGTSLVPDEAFLSARFATQILGASGVGRFDAVQLEKAMAGKFAWASPSLGELEEGISGGAAPSDLETLFQLIYLHFLEPRADEDAFASFLSKATNALENRERNPSAAFSDALTGVLYQHHPRRQPMTTEALARVDREEALAIYRDRFADAGDFTFVFVGNFTPEGLRPLVERYLGSLPSTGREENWRDIGLRRPEGVERVEVRSGVEPRTRIVLTFGADSPWSRAASLDLSLLTDVLQGRLRDQLREEQGAVYGVSVGGRLEPRPRETYQVVISFACDPEKADGLVADVFREIEALRAGEVPARYLANAKEAALQEREVGLKENSFWLSALETYYTFGFDPRDLLTADQRIRAVTDERIQQAAQRYLTPERYVLGVHRPEETAAGAEVEAGEERAP